MSSIYPPNSMLHALSPPFTSFELPSDHISETMGDFFANVIHNSEDREESNKITAEILIRYGVLDTTNARVVADIANRIVYRAPWYAATLRRRLCFESVRVVSMAVHQLRCQDHPQATRQLRCSMELIGYLFATEALLADDTTWAKCKGRLSGGHFSLDDLDLLDLLVSRAAIGKGPQARHSFWEDILEISQTRRVLCMHQRPHAEKRGYSLEALVKLLVEHSRVNIMPGPIVWWQPPPSRSWICKENNWLGRVCLDILRDSEVTWLCRLTPQERRNIPEQIIWVIERRMCYKAPQVSFNHIRWEIEGGITKS
ncbi:hypothetical protein DFP72DRAFT_1069179 [Ephemerocybe angulata]|uniref:Uncharacterized protein n=1 Tax=Ephemerocybe angulata TaxID=980116 RepID=A0A8H6HVH5_9AGAR|nr:hypothetical protein DFP72DRAFT_1069179 [Tulosesus angulatus]